MLKQVARRDSLGCAAKSLAKDQELSHGGITLYRKGVVSDAVSEVILPANDRGFLVGVSMSDGHERRIFHGRSRHDYRFAAGGVYLRNFAEDYRAEIVGSFDFMLFELSALFLRQVAEETRMRPVEGLSERAAEDDPVLSNLVRALAPSLERPGEAHGLFIDQLSLAIATHLLHRYGGGQEAPATVSALLPYRLEMRAKDFIDANLDRDVSIGEVAESCSMSRGYFIRAFRETTGTTPYRWLLGRRVERARQLVEETDLPLAEIATACGFADQSHLSRHFTQLLGQTPGRLRRTGRS
ncbi:helix-turn-helix domain-containing protein [Rhizobium straminoryzae]|nr:AraC family transcriptional regulator [Rhizobium straminoryzae]